MQPSSKLTLNEQSGALLLRTVKHVVEARRQREASQLNLPETLGIKLTNRCNLRCAHCYQWNESGYHRDMDRSEQNLDLDIAVFERLLEETRPVKSRLYLWGGEPLVHREIERILELLEADPRETTICTNAHFIDKHIDAAVPHLRQPGITDRRRGLRKRARCAARAGARSSKVMSALDELLRLRAEGRFKGKLSIHTVISDRMIGRLYELVELLRVEGDRPRAPVLPLVHLGGNLAGDGRVRARQVRLADRSWLTAGIAGTRSSTTSPRRAWTSLMEELRRINDRTWTTKVRYQPGLEFDEIESFVRGESMTARCATTCRVLQTRADITPTGKRQRMQILLGILGREPARSLARRTCGSPSRTIESAGFSVSNCRRRARSATSSICTSIRRRCTSNRRPGRETGVRNRLSP